MFKYWSGNKNRHGMIQLPCHAVQRLATLVKFFKTHASSSYPVLFLVTMAQEVNYDK